MVMIGKVVRIPIPGLVPGVYDVALEGSTTGDPLIGLHELLAKLEGKMVVLSVRELVHVDP